MALLYPHYIAIEFHLLCYMFFAKYCIMINGGTERYGWIMGVSDLEVCELRMPFAKKYIYIYITATDCQSSTHGIV